MFDWTPERLETLALLWADGLSMSQIAERLGTGKNSVVGKVHRLGLPPRPSPIPSEVLGTKPPKRRKRAGKTTLDALPNVADEADDDIAEQDEPEIAESPFPPLLFMPQIGSGKGCAYIIGARGTTEYRTCDAPLKGGRGVYCSDCAEKCFRSYTTPARVRENWTLGGGHKARVFGDAS